MGRSDDFSQKERVRIQQQHQVYLALLYTIACVVAVYVVAAAHLAAASEQDAYPCVPLAAYTPLDCYVFRLAYRDLRMRVLACRWHPVIPQDRPPPRACTHQLIVMSSCSSAIAANFFSFEVAAHRTCKS